jgi:hypothetical protein
LINASGTKGLALGIMAVVKIIAMEHRRVMISCFMSTITISGGGSGAFITIVVFFT